ncbi:MAG: methyltransferase [Clostridiales bacterium]|nr:methyltransferase [Clostridiales bacterium]
MDDTKITFEDLGRRGYGMYQLTDGFRFGTDTVLLAWFTASFIREGQSKKLLEQGSNCGACSLLVSARRPEVHIDAVEVDEDACEVFAKNVEDNDLSHKMRVFIGDVRDLPDAIKQVQYDIVFMNPPFFKKENGPATDESKKGKLQGKFEENGSLEDFIRSGASRLIPTSGLMTIVMTATRASETIKLMYKYGVKVTHFMSVHPFPDRKAEMVLLAGRRTESVPQLEIMPPLILNEHDKETGKVIPSSRIKDIYDKEHSDCFI